MLEAARQHIRASGHPLLITSEAVAEGGENDRCKLCGALSTKSALPLKGMETLICDDCRYEITSKLPEVVSNKQFDYACDALAWHFAGIPRDQLVATSRQFPGHMGADVQVAVDRLFSASPIRFFGIFEQHRYETLSIAALTRDDRNAPAIAPAQYHDVDVGEGAPVKCLNNGLWLCQADGLRYAVVLSSHREYGYEAGTRIEIAVPAGADGAEFVQRCFSELESAVNAARCYRGKVLSLDGDADYRGRTRGVMVHKLPSVQREDVILSEATLKLLDRNVLNFVGSPPANCAHWANRPARVSCFTGRPETGKTHTIRYLASNLPGHTTLIVTAAQVALLAQYMKSRPPSAANDGRDRGRPSDCARSQPDGTLRGIAA